jgi:hypothetical protein
MGLGVHDGQPGAIRSLGPGGHIPEFDENLRRKVENLTAPVQLQYRPGGKGVLPVGRVRQPHQNAGIEKERH